MKPLLLFLFADNWDRAALADAHALSSRFTVVHAGFDLFRFPECARILAFDARRWLDRLVARYRYAGVAGVVSTNEQYGALIAAVLAQRLGLPGNAPDAVVRAQHKFHAREALARAMPEANPGFALLPHTIGGAPARDIDPGIAYPFFVKPVKGAFSVLARRVDHADDLAAHLTFGRLEAHLIRRLLRPFADLMDVAPDCTVDPARMLGEALMTGVQVNVDGWMDRGTTGFFGVVDAVMYAGTSAFQRFEYPSRLPADLQARACAVAARALHAIGFTHGAFNVELFVDAANGQCRVIEINPRLAAQFGDLYAQVDGIHPYEVLADLATGRAPRWSARAGRCGAAASFVMREFGDAVKRAPKPAERAWLARRHPDARLHTFIKRGLARRREAKWLGSYRYAIVNVAGADRDDLACRHADIVRHLRFGAGERAPRPHGTGIDALSP
jgi:hypothetical protein